MENFIWLALIILFAVIETASPQFVAFSFALGSAGALLSSFLGAEIWMQVIIALAIAVVLLVAVRPFVRKYFMRKTVAAKADQLLGSEGTVTAEIRGISGRGRIEVLGASWPAYTEEGTISFGKKVIVDNIDGIKLRVREKKD